MPMIRRSCILSGFALLAVHRLKERTDDQAAIPAHSLAAPPWHVNHRIYEGIDPSFGFDTCRMALKEAR